MFITDQHRQQIWQYFAEMDRCIGILQKVAAVPADQFRNDTILQAAGERALHIALECATDVGNLIIDALIMRDPSSYEDIVQVLAEENVFPQTFTKSFMEVVQFRRILAHEYLQRDVDRLYRMIAEHTGEFAQFQSYVADYVKLGSPA
ncbi:type VII toxin-antitoxin system HepT family RNase toxin [Effusibacillus pohliae]|uniref:type VII toxin-antitoxin system HepT family RNase toxin n=1 Tax=Effusibacillus pohliae TaxID=232270 RepID=UPI00037D63BC|nr:DUF86 domain-containing protein [Effusibacillus pohliae]